jgi:pyruvate/2-oxoglutarate dehydrogenase complex dihydrolipoamide dehydrogenase (E3) component
MYDVIVIGGGSGGLNASIGAAAIGAKVALVEKDRLGGECTWTACIPSKALLHAAMAAHQARQCPGLGIEVPEIRVDFGQVMRRIKQLVGEIAAGETAEHLGERGVEVLFGTPRFEAYDTLILAGRDGMEQRLQAKHFIVATGSRSRIPAIPGLSDAGYVDHASFWELSALPSSVLVIGAGAVGVEFAQALQRLGARVTLFARSGILRNEDPEVGEVIGDSLRAEGVEILTGLDIEWAARDGAVRVLHARRRDTREVLERRGDLIFVAAGRLANTDGLELEKAGIKTDPDRGIPVDEHMQTSAPTISAIGDVTGMTRYTHAAEQQTSVVLANILLRIPKTFDPSNVPRTVYCDPEVACLGMTRSEAIRRYPRARTFRVPFALNDRARIERKTIGYAEITTHHTGQILSAVVVGMNATAVIQELAIIKAKGMSVGELMDVTHAYPTVSGITRALATSWSATRLERPLVQKALKWVFGLDPRRIDRAQDPDVESR